VTPEDTCKRAARGELPKVLLVVGEEEHSRKNVVDVLKESTLAGGMPGLNEDVFVAGESTIDQVLTAARTLPMFGKKRFVLVKHLERWETSQKSEQDPLDRLLEYAKSPSSSTQLVLVASKLDGRKKLVADAKKADYLVSCAPLPRAALPKWVEARARERGAVIAPSIADLLVEITGTDLPSLADAVERLVLYVGPGKDIDETAITTCLTRMQTSTVWELVGAVGRKDLGAALRAVDLVYDPHDRGLPLVGVMAWSARQLIKFEAAIRSGCAPAEAAQRAGAPPFKARELADQVKLLSRAELERWLETLARVDLSLKGGTKRPPKAVIEEAVMTLCKSRGPARPAGSANRPRA
jgi:DNA polymerase III subunit delta